MGRNKKTYTDEFKKKCIQELMEGKSASEVCADNSISPSTLSDWKKELEIELLKTKMSSAVKE